MDSTEANASSKVERPWWLYILRCKDHSLYIGISIDPDTRLVKHNRGMGSTWVRDHGGAVIVYSEKLSDYGSARSRESQIKRWSRIKKERLIAGSL